MDTVSVQNKELRHRLSEVIYKSPSRNKVRRISLFGSRLHDNAKDTSDIDLLIEISDVMGLIEFASLRQYLEDHLGLPVDLVESESLSKYFREEVEREAQVLYES